MPVGAWLNGPLEALLRDTLEPVSLKNGGIFEPAYVTRMIDAHRDHVADHRKPLWTLLVLELWRRAHRVSMP
jgi:asparagine synthase (glutamine-hydrolysing)